MSETRFTVEERRVLLDLVDEENSRDRRTHLKGRTTPEVFEAQSKLYASLRFKLVAQDVIESPDGQTTPG
jgi:hypothetical protein